MACRAGKTSHETVISLFKQEFCSANGPRNTQHNDTQHIVSVVMLGVVFAKCHKYGLYAECHKYGLDVVMLNVIMLLGIATCQCLVTLIS